MEDASGDLIPQNHSESTPSSTQHIPMVIEQRDQMEHGDEGEL